MTIEYVNPVIEAGFGGTAGRKCYEYFHDRSDPCPWCKNKEVFAGQSVQWEWYSYKTGKTYELFDTPVRNPDGSISKLEIFHDITERKMAEQSALENKDKLEAALASMTDAVFVSDADGNFIDFNEAFATFPQVQRAKRSAPKSLQTILCFWMCSWQTESRRHWISGRSPERFEARRPPNAEYTLRHKGTGETWVGSYSFAPILDQDGAIVGSVVTCSRYY